MANTVTYQNVLHSTALRMNALVGSQPAALETTYLVSPLTAANFKSADWPFSSFRDSILLAEEKLAHAIANVGEHPWRQALTSATVALANLASMPALDAAGLPIIGIWGAVYDSSDNITCSRRSTDEIRRRVRNANTNLVVPAYWFNIQGGHIEHTRTNVKIECCAYSRAAQATAFAANGTILLPDVLEEAYVSGAVANMTRDNAYEAQAKVFASHFADTLNMIARGIAVEPVEAVTGKEAA